VVQPQAEVHPVLGSRLNHGEDTALCGHADECLAGLHCHQAQGRQRRQHRVKHGPKLRPIGVLAGDQFVSPVRLDGGAVLPGGDFRGGPCCLCVAAFHLPQPTELREGGGLARLMRPAH
jgi:hypothetical protein